MDLENIDTSYWQLKDKEWNKRRKEEWISIENMISHRKSKKAMAIIKQYYLKGKMPKWDDLKYWDDFDRHLDVFLFLWLHPSDEEEYLITLFKTYMESDLLHERDAVRGFGAFYYSQVVIPTLPYKSMDEVEFPYLGVKAMLLFRVMFSDMEYVESCLRKHFHGDQFRYQQEGAASINAGGISAFLLISDWLSLSDMLPVNENWILTEDQPVEWWYQSCQLDKEDFFDFLPQKEVAMTLYKKALYDIHNFDIENEGDTCRTRFVQKIRKILDERDFISEFKQMWFDVKSGRT